ncbi:MAG: hypothetical protein V2I67_02810 [Thermoanaerobaculales bacterium]|jgi:hypothetical protein|nr:hypothetical protein [Thermoanaerobaculales bacterium]
MSLRKTTLWLLVVVALSGPVSAQLLGPGTLPEGMAAQNDDCSNGVVKDDGTLETGYGWVPSVVDGRYVQRFAYVELDSRKLEEVCVCWTRTGGDDEITFRVHLYRDSAGVPLLTPEASLEAVAAGVPEFPEGAFVSVDVRDADMRIPTDVSYIGVEWDPSVDTFFFVCADHSDVMPVTDGWFIDDRADEWTSVLETSDPIFAGHRAMMIRAVGVEGYQYLIPTLGTTGIIVMVVVIAFAASLLLRKKR